MRTVVAHRQVERAHAVAHRYQAEMATWDELPGRLASTDIVISSTAAPHYILQRRHIEDALQHRPAGSGPLYLIDLAVPRDIDPAAGQLPGVHLHNVDDLQAVVRTTLEERTLGPARDRGDGRSRNRTVHGLAASALDRPHDQGVAEPGPGGHAEGAGLGAQPSCPTSRPGSGRSWRRWPRA